MLPDFGFISLSKKLTLLHIKICATLCLLSSFGGLIKIYSGKPSALPFQVASTQTGYHIDSPIVFDNYWNLPVEKIIAKLDSDVARRLSMREANVRLKHFGRNALETKIRETALGLILKLLISVQNSLYRWEIESEAGRRHKS